jgi:hypothetical protein
MRESRESVRTGLSQAYESLRRQAMAGGPGPASGLTLFLHRGMLSWMRAMSAIAPAVESRPTPALGGLDGLSGEEAFPLHARGEVTRVLVGMALGAWAREG